MVVGDGRFLNRPYNGMRRLIRWFAVSMLRGLLVWDVAKI